MLFPPEYEPHGVPLVYDGEKVALTPEEVRVRAHQGGQPPPEPGPPPLTGWRRRAASVCFLPLDPGRPRASLGPAAMSPRLQPEPQALPSSHAHHVGAAQGVGRCAGKLCVSHLLGARAQEEVASFYAVMLDTEYVKKKVFNDNFWAGFQNVLVPKHKARRPPSP